MKIQPNYTITNIQKNKNTVENKHYNFSKGLMTDTFVRTTQPSFKSVARAEAVIEKFAPKVGLFERNPKKMALAGFFLMFDKYPEVAIRPENIDNLLMAFEDEPKVLKELLTQATDLESRVYYTPMSKLTENAKNFHFNTATLMTDIFKKDPEAFLELIHTMDYEGNTLASQFYDNKTAETVMYDVFEGRNDLLAKAVLYPDNSGSTYAHRLLNNKFPKLLDRLKSTPDILTDVLETKEQIFKSQSVAMEHLVYLDSIMEALAGRPDLKTKVLDSLREGFVSTSSDYFKDYLKEYQDKPEELTKVYEKYKEPLFTTLYNIPTKFNPTKFNEYKEIFKNIPETIKDIFFIQKTSNGNTLATSFAKAYPSGFYDMLEMFKDDNELITHLKTMKNSDGEYLVNILPPDDRVKAIVGSDYVETLQHTKLNALREKKMNNEEYFETFKANKDNIDVLNILLDKFEEVTPSQISPEDALMLIEAEKCLNRDPKRPITKKLAIYFSVAEEPKNYYVKNIDIEGFKNYNKVISEVPGLIESVYGKKIISEVLHWLNEPAEYINEIYRLLADKPELLVNQFLDNTSLMLLYGNKRNELVELYPRIKDAKNFDELMKFLNTNVDFAFYSIAAKILSNCVKQDKISQKYNTVMLNDNQVFEIMEQNELDENLLLTSFEKTGRPLIHAFVDIQINDENKDRYLNIVEKLKKLDIDWNVKDIMDVPLIEKIITSENVLLIDLIKDKEFDWNPYLDFAYNRVQSEDFKGLLKTLNFKFPDLIKSVEVQSLEAFKKTIDQLNSPLCNKEKTIAEVINAIKNIADVKGMDFIKVLAENL